MKILLAILPLVFTLTLAFADDADLPDEPAERPIPEFQEMILPAKDEAAKDASFVKFRQALLKAVGQRSVKDLEKLLDPKIKNSFGGSDGVKEFKQTWKLGKNPGKSALWAELGKVLKLGGGFMGSDFAAPYVYSEWPDEYDSFDYAAVVADDAKLRQDPKESAAVLRPLKREIVFLVSAQEGVTWQEIATFDKKRGWVKHSKIHSPVGYRALFAKKNGAWKMTHFIAGD